MRVSVAKLSLCPCGFTILNEGIPLGAQYDIDPAQTEDVILQCGGCKTMIPLTVVYAYRRGKSGGGFLPEGIFSHKSTVLEFAQ